MVPRLPTSVCAACRAPALALLAGSLLVATAAARAQEARAPRAVLVTGASSGIGLRMTEVLSRNGFFVYAGARDRDDLERLDRMANVKAVRLDVTIQRDIDAAAALVRTQGRGLFGLVNNAGVSVMGPLIELPDDDMTFQLGVNLFGPYRVTRAFADLLLESRGRILNVSSIAGILSGPFSGAYSMSKHGVEAYTDALAAELARFGVAVAAVEPGNYKSQIVASMVRRMKERGYSAAESRYGSMLDMISGPLDRSQYDEPDDVARAALEFLSSETPRHRYMVVPNQAEAAMTIRQAMQELVQLNEGHAYTYGREELIRMLDEALGTAGPPPAPSTAGGPATGLHEAALTGNLEAVRRHIESGADLDARDPSGGSSPLIIAATFGRTEVARALIAAGADLDQRNNDGSTALLTAALLCRTEIVRALLDAGADKSIRNNSGSTPLQVVTVPFEAIKGVYDYLGTALGPYGLTLDYERIRQTRPKIAAMLQ
jgi:NAD(P)-dependent dehydrogenase (short-subunit alcohol dehydrogenase family)